MHLSVKTFYISCATEASIYHMGSDNFFRLLPFSLSLSLSLSLSIYIYIYILHTYTHISETNIWHVILFVAFRKPIFGIQLSTCRGIYEFPNSIAFASVKLKNCTLHMEQDSESRSIHLHQANKTCYCKISWDPGATGNLRIAHIGTCVSVVLYVRDKNGSNLS